MSSFHPLSDPRVKETEKEFKREKTEGEGDYYTLLSLLAGVAGFMLKYKSATWLALVFALGSIANINSYEVDYKQIVSSNMFAIMGLVMNYRGGNQQSLSIFGSFSGN
mmetsp:Transcript_50150/g.129075  ORF Transcript_50150/g.129075 Transcript_50150/m.129075 type:complete len:108 (-) Transcript_50150:860-1183(-)